MYLYSRANYNKPDVMTNGMAEKKLDLNEGETEEANHPAH